MATERIHVVTHDDGWAVKLEGKSNAESVHPTQKEAIEAGRELAQKHEADLVIHRQDGTFRNVYSYEDTEMSTREGNGKHADGSNHGADAKHATAPKVEANDVVSVGSRVSWGAILAGASVALSMAIALALLGAAAGMTTHNKLSDRTLSIGAMIWLTFSTLISLFVGGFVVSRCTAGEDKTEAVTYGVILWGVLFVAMASMTAIGINVGFQAMAQRPDANFVVSNEVARKANLNDANLARLNEEIKNAAPAVNPTAVAWWAFAACILSIGAAVAGSLAGAGPTLVLRQIRFRRGAVAPAGRPTTTTVTAAR